jgi:PST family polysaccharide transporter
VAALTIQVVLVAAFGLWLLTRRRLLPWRGRFDWRLNRRLVRIGGAVTITLFSSAASLLAVRSIVLATGTAADNGFLQAVWAITSQLTAVVISVLNSYTLPRASQAADRATMDAVLNQSCTYALLLVAPPLVIFASIPGLVVSALYSDAFQPAVVLAAPKALGDLLYVTLWPLGTPLLVAERLRAYIGLNLIGSVLLVIGTGVLFPSFGLAGVGWAYVGAMLTWLVCYLVDQYAHGFRLSSTTVLLLATGGAVLLALSLVPIESPVRYLLGGGFVLAWCGFAWRLGFGAALRGLVPFLGR